MKSIFSAMFERLAGKSRPKRATEDCQTTGISKGNPGIGSEFVVGFANGERTWEERADLVQVLGDVLSRSGRSVQRRKDALETTAGLVLRPQIVSLQPQHPKGAKTVTTIEFAHSVLGEAKPFEFQHAIGDDANEALLKGFEQWAQIDLPAVLCAVEGTPNGCTVMQFEYPPNATRAAKLSRRVVLGPTAHLVAKSDPVADEDHPFCPCCLLTNSRAAFDHLLEANEVFAVRLFAARDEQGVTRADCRVNGEDFEAGRVALAAYAGKWPARGFEFRKQYVIMQTASA